MKNLFLKHKWLFLILGAALMALGGLAIWFVLTKNENHKITYALCILLAVYFFLFAAILLLSGIVNVFKSKTAGAAGAFISAGSSIGLGITLCFEEVSTWLESIVLYLVPYTLIGIGGACLILTLCLLLGEETRQNYKTWIVYLVFGAITLTLGVILVNNKSDTLKWIYGSVAAVIALVGLVFFVYGLFYGFRKPKDNEPIEAIEEPKEITKKKRSK